MADSFRADASALTGLAARYRGAAPVVEGELLDAGRRIGIRVEATAKHLAPVDTGTLRRSITNEARPFAAGVRVLVGTAVPYAPDIELGRKPGTMVPEGALLAWMKRKGIDPGAEYRIRLAIFRRGTRAQPFLRPALDQNRDAIVAEVRAVPRRVLARLGAAPPASRPAMRPEDV